MTLTRMVSPWSDALEQAGLAAAESDADHVCLPAGVTRQGTALLNQQFWLWGRDARHPAGNLLVAHGFAKRPPPPGLPVPSRYELTLANHDQIVLWGFGLHYLRGADGGVFLGRAKFAPRLVGPLAPLWEPGALPPLRRPATPADWVQTREILSAALRWITCYERDILTIAGEPYRRDCLLAWRRPACAAGEIPRRWWRLSAAIDASLRRGVARSDAAGSVTDGGTRTEPCPDRDPPHPRDEFPSRQGAAPPDRLGAAPWRGGGTRDIDIA